ncbi:unnamed protein product [Notodromas monacha]|uniref:Uncharacterized protein n=1 Tax=Notodromas monacha TaxID=399045 RepID=A0A7R9BEU1_9CRUS|nr:unnamed protein product [Notodromas monacha]CAG0913513.1 unnamed protein product [Notodromas monacha]
MQGDDTQKSFLSDTDLVLVTNLLGDFHAEDVQVPVYKETVGRLIGIIHRLSSRMESIAVDLDDGEKASESLRTVVLLVKHQLGIAYSDWKSDSESWKDEKKKLLQKIQDAENQVESLGAQLQSYEGHFAALDRSGEEMKVFLAESARKCAAVQANSSVNLRKLKAQQVRLSNLIEERDAIVRDALEIEKHNAIRIDYLERFKVKSSFKLKAMQKTLDRCVPEEEVRAIQKTARNLAAELQNVLRRRTKLLSDLKSAALLEVEVKHLQVRNEKLFKELEEAKIQSGIVAVQYDKNASEKITDLNIDNNALQMEIVSRQLLVSELREKNEKEKCYHYMKLYKALQTHCEDLEARNEDLEKSLESLNIRITDQGNVEADLMLELSSAVSKSEHVGVLDRLRKAEMELIEIKDECEKLKQIAHIAKIELDSRDRLNSDSTAELANLRKSVEILESSSDLHLHISELMQEIGKKNARLEQEVEMSKAHRKELATTRGEIQVLKAELDETNDKELKIREYYQAKLSRFQAVLRRTQEKYLGSLPLRAQLHISDILLKVQEQKVVLAISIREAQEKERNYEELLQKLKISNDVVAALPFPQKCMLEAQVSAKMLNWKVERLQAELQQANLMKENAERSVDSLQRELIEVHRLSVADSDEDKLPFDVVDKKDISCLKEIGREAKSVVSTSVQVVLDLDQNFDQRSEQHSRRLDIEIKCDQLVQENERLKKLMEKMRSEATEREKIITELRLKVLTFPSSQPSHLEKELLNAAMAASNSLDSSNISQTLVKVAQNTIACLQKRVVQKDEMIERLSAVLKDAREESREISRIHTVELEKVHRTVHKLQERAVERLKIALSTEKDLEKETTITLDEKEFRELESKMYERNRTVDSLKEKLEASKRELEYWRKMAESRGKEADVVQMRLTKTHEVELKTLKEEINRLQRDLQMAAEERFALEAALETMESAVNVRSRQNPFLTSPTLGSRDLENSRGVTLKSLVSKLRNQLAEKEKQQGALAAALAELKAEVTKRNGNGKVPSDAIKFVEADEMWQKEVEELRKKLKDMKEVLKNSKDSEAAAKRDMEELKENLAAKSSALVQVSEARNALQRKIISLQSKVGSVRVNQSGEKKRDTKKSAKELELEDEIKKLQKSLRESEDLLKTSKSEREKQREDFFKWDEKKKLEQKLDQMKSKLKERESRIEVLEKADKSLRDLLKRMEKRIQKRSGTQSFMSSSVPELEQANDDSQEAFDLRQSAVTPVPSTPPSEQVQSSTAMKEQHQLEEKISRLKTDLAKSREEHLHTKLALQEARLEIVRLGEEKKVLALGAELKTKASGRHLFSDRRASLPVRKQPVEPGESSIKETVPAKDNSELESSRKRIGDLERTVSALRRIIETLEREKQRRVSFEEFPSSMPSVETKAGRETVRKALKKLLAERDCVVQELKAKNAIVESLSKELSDARLKRKLACEEAEHVKRKMERILAEGLGGPRVAFLETKVRALEDELADKKSILMRVKILLKDAASREKEMIAHQDALRLRHWKSSFKDSADNADTSCYYCCMRRIPSSEVLNNRRNQDMTMFLLEFSPTTESQVHDGSGDAGHTLIERTLNLTARTLPIESSMDESNEVHPQEIEVGADLSEPRMAEIVSLVAANAGISSEDQGIFGVRLGVELLDFPKPDFEIPVTEYVGPQFTQWRYNPEIASEDEEELASASDSTSGNNSEKEKPRRKKREPRRLIKLRPRNDHFYKRVFGIPDTLDVPTSQELDADPGTEIDAVSPEKYPSFTGVTTIDVIQNVDGNTADEGEKADSVNVDVNHDHEIDTLQPPIVQEGRLDSLCSMLTNLTLITELVTANHGQTVVPEEADHESSNLCVKTVEDASGFKDTGNDVHVQKEGFEVPKFHNIGDNSPVLKENNTAADMLGFEKTVNSIISFNDIGNSSEVGTSEKDIAHLCNQNEIGNSDASAEIPASFIWNSGEGLSVEHSNMGPSVDISCCKHHLETDESEASSATNSGEAEKPTQRPSLAKKSSSYLYNIIQKFRKPEVPSEVVQRGVKRKAEDDPGTSTKIPRTDRSRRSLFGSFLNLIPRCFSRSKPNLETPLAEASAKPAVDPSNSSLRVRQSKKRKYVHFVPLIAVPLRDSDDSDDDALCEEFLEQFPSYRSLQRSVRNARRMRKTFSHNGHCEDSADRSISCWSDDENDSEARLERNYAKMATNSSSLTHCGNVKPDSSHTIGVEFGSKVVNVGGKSVKLQVWDTAGQERFRSVTRSYYRAAAGALLVYDVASRESFNNLSEWLSDARKLASPNIVILLVGNKKDLEEEREIPFLEASRFAQENEIMFLETSALTGDHVEEAFLKCSRTILARIDAGELDPERIGSGIQLGDATLKKIRQQQQLNAKNECSC